MDVVDLLKFINSDLTWSTVKKGHRTRRPRRPGASNNVQETVVSDYEKSGVAILGQHFAEAVDVPIKKRILLLESPSLSGEQARSPQSHLASPHRECSEMLVKHALGEDVKLNEEKLPNLNDFSGIELLADAACHGSVYDNSCQVESMEVEVLTTPIVVSDMDGIKDDTTPMDSEDLPVQDSTVPVTQCICDNGNVTGDKSPVPQKAVRFYWDLNAIPEEELEEEPCCDNLVDPQPVKSCIEVTNSDCLQNAKTNLETRNSQVTEDEKGSTDHDATFSIMPVSKPEALGTQGNDDVCSNEVVGTITCKTSNAESCDISKSDVVDSFIHPAKYENVSTSTDSVSLERTTVTVEPLIKSDDGQAVSEVLQGGCLSLKGYDDKPTSEDRLSDFCGSNASEDEHAEGNTIDKVKAGYDSPVEDGELREPDRFPWQNEELEEKECVDYESDNMYEDNFDSMESSENEISLDQQQTIGAVGAETVNSIEHHDRVDVSDRMNSLQEHSQSDILEDKDGNSGKYISERRILHNEFGGGRIVNLDRSTSTSFDVRKTGTYIRRSRSDNIGDTYSRDERDFGPEKFMGRDRPSYQRRTPNDASGQWGGSFSRNSHGYPRPKNSIGGPVVRSGGSDTLDKNQPISYNPRVNYRTFNTADRNESYGSLHRGPPPARVIIRDGYSGGLRRVPREEYKAPEPCHSERKISSSSNFNQSTHLSRSRKRSRSRSRSGSPIAWHFQKKGNLDTKELSPDYRPDTRLPLRKPGEIESRLAPPTRCHVSPQRISRSFDDRNVINGPYRDRRSSPVRNFHRDQRFEAGGYPGKLKSNDHFRPTPRPERFPPNREKFEANSDDKYGMMNRGRPFRNDTNNYFKDHNKVNGFRYTRNEDKSFRDPVRRDIPKNTSEENGCRYTTNKMFGTVKGDFHKDN
ncbi:hypothetical protein CTI12_AA406580 [Artemisia annua]|uniref:Uncharacterized protein n=1 Tax=Artemisia annua TaxID=35608 RepID=A0A2U1M9V8_ARTAN|nr:hypothetical protein CTI12_AA406580 [Artemisia annua]